MKASASAAQHFPAVPPGALPFRRANPHHNATSQRVRTAVPREALEAAGSMASPPAPAQQPSGTADRPRAYPHIDRRFQGLEQVHADPPVYRAHGFLSPADCQALREAAEEGQLQPLPYDNKALVDTHRLWPLAFVVTAGAAFDAWHALPSGSSAVMAADVLAAAAGPALLRWSALVGGLLGAALLALNSTVGGRVFTGTKWTTTRLDPGHTAAPAVARFLHNTCSLLATPVDRLEPPTVTRYEQGQYQRRHFDARPDGDPSGLKQFLEAGGQRLVQVVVYLNSLEEQQGGGTRFCHPCMDGLTVQPQLGDCLVFFPALADGKFDDRMAHAGEPVLSGEKWILNTWACQRRVPSAVTHLPSPAAMGAAR